MTGKDDVNRDDAEEVGRKLQQSNDNMKLTEAKIKRWDQMKPLASIYNIVKICQKFHLHQPNDALHKVRCYFSKR